MMVITNNDLRNMGMNDELIELFRNEEYVSDLEHRVEVSEKMNAIKDNRITQLSEECEEMKELLAENDIYFGDMINQSDRGSDMLHGD